MPQLRLASVDISAGDSDRFALVRLIIATEADVVCLHGAPHGFRWRAATARLARESGLVIITGGPPAGGSLLLSNLAVDLVAVHDVGLHSTGRGARAGAALAILRAGGAEFALAAATLSGDPLERLCQARRLQSQLDTLAAQARPTAAAAPAVVSVCGVEHPGTPVWQALAEQRADVATSVFVDRRITVTEVQLQPAVVVELGL